MYPPLFGPHIWDTLMYVALNYPTEPTEEQQQVMTQFLTTLVRVLPCPGCANHAIKYVELHPPHVSNGEKLLEWVVAFHNHVNIKLKKPVMSVLEAKQALILRNAAQIKQLPRALQIREEDALRIQNLQFQIQRLQESTTTNNETLYFWIMIGLSVLSGLLLLLVLYLAIRRSKK